MRRKSQSPDPRRERPGSLGVVGKIPSNGFPRVSTRRPPIVGAVHNPAHSVVHRLWTRDYGTGPGWSSSEHARRVPTIRHVSRLLDKAHSPWSACTATRWTTPGARAPGGSNEEDIVADTYNGYCVKCKEKRDFEGRVEVSKTGMKMAKGTCPVCGTTVNRILGKA